MKEQLVTLPNSEIIWPQTGKVEVGPDVDFVYIMRKDGRFAMSPIAQKMFTDSQLDEGTLFQTLVEEYDTFFAELADSLKWGYSLKGNFELHLFDADDLDQRVRLKANGLPIVSLDPLMNQGVYEHRVSRGYYLGGRKDFGQVPRPGSEKLSHQAEMIAQNLNGQPACVSEDDIFSGGSVIASLSELLSRGVNIQKVIPGIQVGKPEKLFEMGIPVDPAVTYETTDGTDVFDKVDLGDPRDYLLGASGLVLKLPNGHYGRAPYILPFVSTTARAGIPQEFEKEFATKVLQINFDFYKNIEETVGKPVLLKNMDPGFVVLMNEMFGFDSNTPMDRVVAWSMNNLDKLWEITKAQGEFQERLELLKLPQKIVFLDVNGTLFPDESTDGHISEENILLLKQTISNVKEKGLSVGLCSDSPLPQLQELAEKLGVDGPIFAENANILYYNNQVLIFNELPDIDTYKEEIRSVASNCRYEQRSDCISPEFGGEPVDVQSSLWSYGANRMTSITVFGPSPLIQQLGLHFRSKKSGFSIDCSPEYNFFAIHPGENYKLNKGRVLETLSIYGHTIVMIGNSMSDWVEPDQGVVCAFVCDAKIDHDTMNKAGYISDKSTIKGVIDILEKIV